VASMAPLEVTVHVLQGSLDKQNEILERIANALAVVAAAHELHLKRDDRIYG